MEQTQYRNMDKRSGPSQFTKVKKGSSDKAGKPILSSKSLKKVPEKK